MQEDLNYIENLYTDLFDFLSDSFDQLKSIQEDLKSRKNSDKKTSKKPTKPKKSKTIKETTTEQDIDHFKRMIRFLINQYEKTANK